MKRPPKKDDTLEIRLPQETKQAFMERCRSEGRSASVAVRGFIETCLARPLMQKELPMYVRPVFATAAFTAIAAVGLTMFTATPSRAEPDFKAIFASLDANGDGKLTAQELDTAPKPNPAPAGKREGRATLSAGFAEMDTNRDGGVSVAEFAAFNRAAMERRFLALDADSDGRITLAELERQSAPTAEAGSGYAITGAARGFFMKFDANKDGAISEAEFNDPPS